MSHRYPKIKQTDVRQTCRNLPVGVTKKVTILCNTCGRRVKPRRMILKNKRAYHRGCLP